MVNLRFIQLMQKKLLIFILLKDFINFMEITQIQGLVMVKLK